MLIFLNGTDDYYETIKNKGKYIKTDLKFVKDIFVNHKYLVSIFFHCQ